MMASSRTFNFFLRRAASLCIIFFASFTESDGTTKGVSSSPGDRGDREGIDWL